MGVSAPDGVCVELRAMALQLSPAASGPGPTIGFAAAGGPRGRAAATARGAEPGGWRSRRLGIEVPSAMASPQRKMTSRS
ncbi:hypothetical protein ASD89_11490 [Caulobacter sp. Root656]|nr:hypothetical protein ASD89_11490 [Caulobacter sp. Root656]